MAVMARSQTYYLVIKFPKQNQTGIRRLVHVKFVSVSRDKDTVV
jgi:hypothetical protein